jgi:hypothetical protein
MRKCFQLAFLFASVAPVAIAAVLTAGTEIDIRLTSEVSSKQPAGTPVSAVVIAPVLINGAEVIARGATLSGQTADVVAAEAATDQTEEKAAQLRIDFKRISAGTQTAGISCVVLSVDNARESIDSAGLITGIKASSTYSARIDKGIDKVKDRYSGLAGIFQDVKSALVKEPDPTIDYKAGIDLTIKLKEPLHWNPPVESDLLAPVRPERTLVKVVASLPMRTVAQKPPSPSDLTNLMFIGTREQMQAAFVKAGWHQADPLGRSSDFRIAVAMIQNSGYDEAPVSILYLDGRPPDIVFEKQNNTFAQRDHIRVWQSAQTFDGRPVWIAAATHDIKISFSAESRSFTHGIDSHIDRERTKVVNDLEFTGEIEASSLLPRAIPQNISNATGDQLITDGKLAVLELYNR